MADFLTAHKRTLKFEGGYSNEPDDNGNWTGGKKGSGYLIGTNYGITAWELQDYLGRIPTVLDMYNLKPDVAAVIYKHHYWDKIKGDEIMNQDEANMIYDTAVNMGVGTSIKIAQRTMGLHETGIMDAITLAELNFKK
jgi:lysozyme family protein